MTYTLQKLAEPLYLEHVNSSLHRNDIIREINLNNESFSTIISIVCLLFSASACLLIFVSKSFDAIWWKQTRQNLLDLLCFVISSAALPIIAVLLLVGASYRQLVGQYLKYKYGEKFRGLMQLTDIIWSIEDASKSIINVLAIVESGESQSTETLLHRVRQKFKNIFFENNIYYGKMLYTRHEAFGFNFWLDSDLQVEDCVRKVDFSTGDEVDKQELKKILSQYANNDLPKGHTANWELLVSSKPVSWKKTAGTRNGTLRQYPLIFRVHHSVGDGVALLKLMLSTIADGNEYKELDYSAAPSTSAVKCETMKTEYFFSKVNVNGFRNIFCVGLKKLYYGYIKISNFALNIFVAMIAPTMLVRQLLIRKKDRNVFHGPELVGEKVLAWSLDENIEDVERIKRIKNSFGDMRFSDVLLTAISGAFTEYMSKKSTELPLTLTSVIPVTAGISDMAGVHPSKFKNTKILLQNAFTVGLYNMPLDIGLHNQSPEENIIERLFAVKRSADELRYSHDFKVNYWFLNVISAALPIFVLRPILRSGHCTISISSIPGPCELTVCGGHNLVDLLFWPPHRGFTGMGLSALTYGNRLQLGLIIDKALVNDIDEVQDILNAIPKYLKYIDFKINC